MLSQSFSPFRQRRPNRKASTPFLPGAWPSSSGSEDPTKDDVSSSVNEPHDANGHPPALEKSPQARISSPLPHLDHVMNFHRQISDTLSPTIRRQVVSREDLSTIGGVQTASELVSIFPARFSNLLDINVRDSRSGHITSTRDQRSLYSC